MAPEEEARAEIDKLLGGAGWSVQSREHVDLTAVFAALRKRRQLGQGEGRQARSRDAALSGLPPD